MGRVSIVIGAGHIIAALFTEQLALALGQTAAADGTVEHGFLFGTRLGFRHNIFLGVFAHCHTIIDVRAKT
jgi:hypothetical protein